MKHQVFAHKLLCMSLLFGICLSAHAQTPNADSSNPSELQKLMGTLVKVGKIEAGTTLNAAIEKYLRPERGFGSGFLFLGYLQENFPLGFNIAEDARLLPLPALDLGELPFKDALAKIVEAAGAEYRISKNDKQFSADITRKPSADLQKPIYLEFVQLPFNLALETMLRGTGLNFVISPEIAALKVNANLKNVPLERALKEIMNALGAEYKIADNIIRVSPIMPQPSNKLRLAQAANAPAPLRDMAVVGSVKSDIGNAVNNQQVQSKNIELNYLNASEVAPVIAQQGMIVQSTGGKSVVITGSEDQVKQAESLISSLDNKQSLPKSAIQLTFTVYVKRDKNEKAPGPFGRLTRQQTIGTLDGQFASVGSTSTVPYSDSIINEFTPTITAHNRISNEFTPTITAYNRISIAGKTKMSWKFTDPKRGEINFKADLPFAVSLELGKEQKLAEKKISAKDSPDGNGSTLNITATAIIVKERTDPGP